jgi:hypothetical protein
MYGDKWDFLPGEVRHSNYSDGTVIPRLEVKVFRNGEEAGTFEVHMHRVKYSPHASLGLTSRIKSD